MTEYEMGGGDSEQFGNVQESERYIINVSGTKNFFSFTYFDEKSEIKKSGGGKLLIVRNCWKSRPEGGSIPTELTTFGNSVDTLKRKGGIISSYYMRSGLNGCRS